MNITFMFGNGFDVGLGVKSRYEDFYKVYCIENKNDNANIKEFKSMLRNRKNEIIDWSDFELAFGKHAKDFTLETKDQYIERFEDFVVSFNEYLETEIQKLDYNHHAVDKFMLQGITEFYHCGGTAQRQVEQFIQGFKDNYRFCNFVSFNYTDTVDRCADALRYADTKGNLRVGPVLHVHGYIDENMIMGVNDNSQIDNPALASDDDILGELLKTRQNTDIVTGYDIEVSKLIDVSDLICIYGMSLGETDKLWWQKIIMHLVSHKNSMVVIMAHTNSRSRKYRRFPHAQKDLVQIRKKFLSYAPRNELLEYASNAFIDVDELIDDLARRVIVIGGHDIFSMSLLPTPLGAEYA